MTTALDRLPAAALDRHLAILGTSDAGKTYAAKGEVEQLLDAGRRVCVIDPTGVWWGLRLAPDGVTPSKYAPAIFGGVGPGGRAPPRADVPLAADAGGRLAELVAEGDFSCVIDVSRMSVGDRTRLFADFAESLAQANRRPLHLVIDEAHLFAPQGRVYDPQSGRMLHAANHLVAGGRALGIRIMLLSQRPAKLHKDSLTQVQTLVAMLNVSPQDRAAVRDWITGSADAKAGAEILASLPSLPVGAGWIWAPRLHVLERVQFRPIATFDSSRSPDDTAAIDAKLQPLDLDALRAALASSGTAPDPASPRAPDSDALERVRMEGYQKGFANAAARTEHRVREALLAVIAAAEIQIADASAPVAKATPAPVVPLTVAAKAKSVAADPVTDPAGVLLVAARGANRQVDWKEAALLAGMIPGGGHFNTLRRQLVVAGHAEPPKPSSSTLPHTPEQLLGIFVAKLKPRNAEAANILALIWSIGPMTRESAAGYLGRSSTGGHWNTAWATVRKSALFTEISPGRYDIAPILRELAGAPK